MAYLDRHTDPARRTTAITGVIIVHALIGYVLVTGLVSQFVPRIDPPLTGMNFPLPPPPPPPSPEETHKPTPQAEQPTAPEKRFSQLRRCETIQPKAMAAAKHPVRTATPPNVHV